MIQRTTLVCLFILLYSCRDSNFTNSNFSLTNSHEHSPICKSTWRDDPTNPKCLNIIKSRKRREIEKNQIHLLFEGQDIHCSKIKRNFNELLEFTSSKLIFFTSQKEIISQELKTLTEQIETVTQELKTLTEKEENINQKIKTLQGNSNLSKMKKMFQKLNRTIQKMERKGQELEKMEHELYCLNYLNDHLMNFLEYNLKRIFSQVNEFQNSFKVNHISKKGDQGNWQIERYKNYQNLWKTYVFDSFKELSINFNKVFDKLEQNFLKGKRKNITSNIFLESEQNNIKKELKFIEDYFKIVPQEIEKNSYCLSSNFQKQALELNFFLKEHFSPDSNRELKNLLEGLNYYVQAHIKSEIEKYIDQLNRFDPQICHKGSCPLPSWLEKIKALDLSCSLLFS